MYSVTLEEFQATAKEDRAKYNAISVWHLRAWSQTDSAIELPHRPDATSINVDFSDPVYPGNKKPILNEDGEDTGEWEYDWSRKQDEEKIVAFLSTVAKFARKQGYKVEKDYKYDFSLKVTLPGVDDLYNDITISYSCDREVVCTKKVIGTKVIPAQTYPEKIEEIVEWECEKIAFTA